MVVACFTDVMLHSSVRYHHELALPMATLPNTNNRAACGAVSGRFHGLPTFEVHESVIGRSE